MLYCNSLSTIRLQGHKCELNICICIYTRLHPFLIHHLIPVGKDAAPFMPAV